LSSLSWFIGIFVTFWSINSLNGHNMLQKAAVIGAAVVANFLGSWVGTKLGAHFVKLIAPKGRS